MNLFSGTITSLERGLDYSAVKQKVIANNVANVDTPGYKSKDVSFKSILQNEIQLSSNPADPRHFDLSNTQNDAPAITRRPYSIRENGNGVDMDKEMADLATNQIYYNSLIERIGGKFGSLNSVIKGGGQ
ncbi:flagellar basal body rod protein FlgB [Jeotgalibacillus haloalkalitolerans]|uniref:Flagellar basal body rod protein FlgB n=1 Tax=Jeotgalibacillus haloalkalitolerans TaxID=3104292 RepID=A0ABU5KKC1_9BACL|nr:flagellar basal body rod protein FlgB [Jeotgalibacillus sp. HH7-29]MDZ5711714.1 flagellar basal body rod protein FlgB [Jeotgalibacillus sp. HH7-29]